MHCPPPFSTDVLNSTASTNPVICVQRENQLFVPSLSIRAPYHRTANIVLGQRRGRSQTPEGGRSGHATPERPNFDIFQLYAYPPHTPEAAAYFSMKLKKYAPDFDPECFIRIWEWDTKRAVETGGVWAPDEALKYVFVGILKHKPLDHFAKAKSILRERLNYTVDLGALAGRCEASWDFNNFFETYVHTSPSGGRYKRGLLMMFSTSGSGKTQLLRWKLHGHSEPLAQGYILVCDCANTVFADEVRALSESERDEKAIEHFLVGIIKKHVQLIFGVSLTCDGGDSERNAVESAVSAWKKICDNASGRVSTNDCKYQPLIVLDSTEALPYSSSIKRHSQSPCLTVIEAMVFALPREHGLIVVGCLDVRTVDLCDVTEAMVKRIKLEPFSLKRYLYFLRTWLHTSTSSKVPSAVTTSMRLFHFLSGGVPRQLWQTLDYSDAQRSLHPEKWRRVLDDFVDDCIQRTPPIFENEPPSGEEENQMNDSEKNAVLAMAALCSGARAKVNPQKTVPFTDSRLWSIVQKGMLFSQNKGEAMVPPALFLRGALHSVSVALASAGGDSAEAEAVEGTTTHVKKLGDDLIFPAALVDSWPRGLNLQYMHCPMALNALTPLLTMPKRASVRCKAWELHVAHCIVGRWYFLYLESGRKEQWLSEVLNVDTRSRCIWTEPTTKNGFDLNSITVDFSGGLQDLSLSLDGEPAEAPFALTNNHSKGRHGAKFFATLQGGKKIIVYVRMHHEGAEATEDELMPLCLTSKDAGAPYVDALLSIGSGPSSGADFEDPVLQKRVAHVDGSRFLSPSVIDIFNPKYIDLL